MLFRSPQTPTTPRPSSSAAPPANWASRRRPPDESPAAGPPRGGGRRMRILLLTHYYAPEFGAPQRRWSALVQRFIASGHQVTVAAPVPHYPGGRPTPAQRRTHHVGDIERGAHGDRKSTRLNSSHVAISYAVFCL